MKGKSSHRRFTLLIAVICVCFSASFIFVWRTADLQVKPLSLGDIITALRSKKINSMLLKNRILTRGVNERGISFKLTQQIETELRREGANNTLINAIRKKSEEPSSTPTPELTPTPDVTPTPETTPELPKFEIKTVRAESIGIELNFIPKGSFLMGSPDTEKSREPDEGPQWQVTITNDFWIGKYEVTQEEFEKVVGKNPSYFKDCPRCPVEQVTWNDAKEFIVKLNELDTVYKYRLPSEAEWEYVARAGTKTAFAFGDTLSSEQANFDGSFPYGNVATGNYLQKTAEVGNYQPNAWGIYDMHGNVWEWVEDIYNRDYRGLKDDGSPNLIVGDEDSRILRGGSWVLNGWSLRSAVRNRSLPTAYFIDYGFRVVAEPK